MADPTELGGQEETSSGGVLRRVAEGLARRSGAEVVDDSRLALLEAESEDRRVLRRELDLIAWTALDYVGGNEQDLRAVARRKLVQQARVAWQQDPQLGAAVDLMNDFALGRGVPRPQARDPKVQEILDEAWEDEDNELVLTSYEAQMAFGTDLSLQANIFLLMFTGDDGKVKLAILEHDTVENVVRDENNRRRILYYVARQKTITWDYDTDQPRVLTEKDGHYDRILYFQHWRNEAATKKPPAAKLGKGKVKHVAINKTTEMAFGHPTMHRVLRWATAFNSLMEARVDAAKAAAAFMMKRKVKGTPNQIQKMAAKALSKRGELGRARQDPDSGEAPMAPPRSGSVITENEMVEHESFKLDSGAAGANVDGQMIRSQISAATHFPQHYLGDIGSANLATATSMELPVLKAVESRQEVIEGVFRWFFDRVIQEAIEAGRLSEELSDEEWAEKERKNEQEGKEEEGAPAEAPEGTQGAAPAPAPAPTPTAELGAEAADAEGEEIPEEERQRDLGYDFGLPSPLRRMMADLVNAISTIARTFDPNGTNMDLTRILLGVALGEGLEMSEPGDLVDQIFPDGYVDPAMAALKQAQPEGGSQNGQVPPGMQLVDADGNPYGAPMSASTPEANPYGPTEAAWRPEEGGHGLVFDPRQGVPSRARYAVTTREEALAKLEESQIAARLAPEARRRVETQADRAAAELGRAAEPLRDLGRG